jgi:hypothetical protein
VACLLQGLIVAAVHDLMANIGDNRCRARSCQNHLTHNLPKLIMIGFKILFIDVHQLNQKVDSPPRRRGGVFFHKLFFAQDRHLVFNEKLGGSVPVGNHCVTDQHLFQWF